MIRPRHDLLPDAMTDEERRAQRRFEAGYVFETMILPPERDSPEAGRSPAQSARGCPQVVDMPGWPVGSAEEGGS